MKHYKLGRKPKSGHDKLPKFENFLSAKYGSEAPPLPPIPSAIDWGGKITNWGMMENDQVGDCVLAAIGHADMVYTSNASTLITPSDDDILGAYSDITGYVYGNKDTDHGTNLVEAMNYWQSKGLGGRKIVSYVAANPDNIEHVKAAIALFGSIIVGVDLPDDAEATFEAGNPWTNAANRNYEGGHGMEAHGYDENFIYLTTWGRVQRATWGWMLAFCNETLVPISADWFNAVGYSPNGFNMAQLMADQAAL